MTGSFEQAAWSWTEHLRTGGSTPWADWVASDRRVGATVPAGWTPPGAAQLELVRRAAGLAGQGIPPGFADLVFARSGPARGLAHLPLGWPGAPTLTPFGAPRTDPAEVPVHELVRVGVGALTELLLRASGEVASDWRVRRRVLARDPAFELAGAPVTVSAVRRALAVAGHVEGGRAPQVVLLAEPFDVSLVQVWSLRVQLGAPVRWRGFVARAAHRHGLPASVDLPELARWWARRVGSGQVHVLLTPGGAAAAARSTAELLGMRLEGPRRRKAPPSPPRVLDLSAAAIDVVRRVNAVLAVRAAEQEHARATRMLSRMLADEGGGSYSGQALTVPADFQEWAADRAARLAEDLRLGGYAVHGSLERIVPAFDRVPVQPDRDTVLDLVLTACIRLASTGAHGRTKGRDR